jgi:hypothetical protein
MSRHVLVPYVPDGSDPFDRRKAAHLLRRAGFGAPPGAVAGAVEEGLEAAVEGLFDEARDEEEAFRATFAAILGRLIDGSEATGPRWGSPTG